MEQETRTQVRKLIFAAAIAAIYTAMTFIFAPIAYGSFQFRISEMLTILPFFFPLAVPGLFVGCIIANLLSPYGFADMIVGSAATLFAALCTMRLGKSENSEYLSVKALACLPPVLFNAVFIGALISYFMVGAGETDAFWAAFVVNALQVGFGQLVVIYIIGLPLMVYLPRMGVIKRLKQLYGGAE
ncbi:MAG: QueT transporter family protein [Oscillospiraceae bacterium]|nr:QueT transporter family protein [Oscillospiraceae bacterium]